MKPLQSLAEWLDIRPDEVQKVLLCFWSAFFVIGFMVLARSLREALYLTAFPVETLPYIMAAVAVLSVPTVAIFGRLLARHAPRTVLTAVALIVATGLVLLWPFATRVGPGVVLFYLWTALGTLLLTSGFWVVTSEYFAVRGAKRLYGLIGAGGTAGAMIVGNALVWLTTRVELIWLVPLLIALLAGLLISQWRLPRSARSSVIGRRRSDGSMRESLVTAWNSPHLRIVALIVFTATVATTLLDYQFKELARAHLTTGPELTGFFGAFYAWTGAIALIIQLVLAGRLMSSAGITVSLAILPAVLFLGSLGVLVLPSLVLVTLVRGADNSIRKSLHRSVLEVLYVPVPAQLRRKTKTFIDSVVDSVGEGLGAGVVFLWVTLGGLSSHYLSAFIATLAIVFLYLSRRMGRQYFQTVTERLQEGGAAARKLRPEMRLEGRDLFSGTFTRLDVSTLREEVSAAVPSPSDRPGPERVETSPLQRMRSPDGAVAAAAIDEIEEWSDEALQELCRLLARDALYSRASKELLDLGDRAVPHLIDLLGDDSTDFVIRRRIPRILARAGGPEAADALVGALSANRFEIRYRAAIALVRRRRNGLAEPRRDLERVVWEAVRAEVSRERPVWELQRVLDRFEPEEDRLLARRVGARGELSLEHTFRLLTLVLDPEAVRSAFHGVLLDDDRLKSFALEYLEQVLPPDIRKRLWPFIGDVSEYQRERERRPLGEVVSDLVTTGATLFQDEDERAALRRILEEEGP